jgi:hypothetical protein
MPSEQFLPRDSATTRPKVEKLGPLEDLDAAQHTPLYPSLGRIGYVPNPELYQARLESSTKRLQANGDVSTVPKGWPTVLQGPMVWSGSELQASQQWVYNLSSAEITEVHSGLVHCKGEQIINSLLDNHFKRSSN